MKKLALALAASTLVAVLPAQTSAQGSTLVHMLVMVQQLQS